MMYDCASKRSIANTRDALRFDTTRGNTPIGRTVTTILIRRSTANNGTKT
tara:strand:- start:95 stop:244 length:150 start_codon:yes stop_codon:yes gene_type:complete